MNITLPVEAAGIRIASTVKQQGKLNLLVELSVKVLSGGWNEPGEDYDLYNAQVTFSAKVQVRYGVGFWATLYEGKNVRGQMFSDPGGGFYLQPKVGRYSKDRGLNSLVSDILNEITYENRDILTR